jgi:hypothetical protein
MTTDNGSLTEMFDLLERLDLGTDATPVDTLRYIVRFAPDSLPWMLELDEEADLTDEEQQIMTADLHTTNLWDMRETMLGVMLTMGRLFTPRDPRRPYVRMASAVEINEFLRKRLPNDWFWDGQGREWHAARTEG